MTLRTTNLHSRRGHRNEVTVLVILVRTREIFESDGRRRSWGNHFIEFVRRTRGVLVGMVVGVFRVDLLVDF